MKHKFTFLLGALLVATALALLQTYKEYRAMSDLVVFFIGVVGGLISIFQYVSREK